MQRVIMLRGCMASGKSTIAKKLRSFDSKMAYIKVDSYKDLFDHFENEVRPFVHGAANATLEYLLREGFSVVMEGVFQNPLFVQQAVEVVMKNNVPFRVFQLKVSLKTLQERDQVREEVKEGCREPLGDEAIAVIFNRIEKNPYEGAIELNTEVLSLGQSIAFINDQFDGT